MVNLSNEPKKLRVLLVKTSSLGDVLHNLPVVSDIIAHRPDTRIDWLVDTQFAALPRLHPAVRTVIPVALRRWRKNLGSLATWREIGNFHRTFSGEHYDVSIDTQGLLKSALLMRDFGGKRCGFNWDCAREPVASFFYQRKFEVIKAQHAVERNRQLVAKALSFELGGVANFGIQTTSVGKFEWLPAGLFAVLLHATSRADKCWVERNWVELGGYLDGLGIHCVLPWGSEPERARSVRLSAQIPRSIVPPKVSLTDAASLLSGACAVIGVDTGLAHLAAALNVPTIGVYTATDPALTGLYASNSTCNLGGIGQPPDVAAVVSTLQRITGFGA
ncbi:MAG: lipopolysaccharide heptosyltransferase I [Gallionella sp.]